MTNRVLVVGATGMLGQPVAAALLEHGHAVRVLVRDKAKAQAQLGHDYEFVVGDVSKPESLIDAVAGCSAVHINLSGGMNPTAIEQIEHLGTAHVAKAAAQAGVEQITYLSGGNTSDSPIAHDNQLPMTSIVKSRAEAAIRESGVPYTIFRATMYMETMPQFIRGQTATIIGSAAFPFRWIAASDYAALVTRAIGNSRALRKTFYVKGPEALTLEQALVKYRDRLAPALRISHFPFWMLNGAATVSFNPQLKEMAKSMRMFGKKPEPGDPTECDQILGPLTQTLDQWLNQQASAVTR